MCLWLRDTIIPFIVSHTPKKLLTPLAQQLFPTPALITLNSPKKHKILRETMAPNNIESLRVSGEETFLFL